MTAAITQKRIPKTAKSVQAKTKPAAKAWEPSHPKKKLRIREELLPDSARYITIDDIEYVAMPVADFGEWYEDAIDLAVAEDRDLDPGSAIPAEQVFARLPKGPKAKR